jgi:hypothetical protein
MSLKTLKSLPPAALESEPPPLEAEAPHRVLARLNKEHQRVTEELRELKRSWAQKNIRAQRCRQPIPTAEITHIKNKRRELATQLLSIQAQIGATNKELRERRTAGNDAKVTRDSAPVSNGTKSKKAPLKEHPVFNQYFALAAENELEASLYERIEGAAKSMLSQALKTGIEEP